MKRYTEFVEDFKNYISAIKNYSSEYVRGIVSTLEQFLKFMNSYKLNDKYTDITQFELNDLRILSTSDVYSFVYYLAENELKTNTRVIKISQLKTFFDYLYRIKNSLFKEPIKEIQAETRKESKLPKYLSTNEALKLINLYDNDDKFLSIRNNTMIHLFLTCGLRNSELRNMKISDINLKEGTFRVFGKGKKERMCYLNNSTKES